MNWLWENRTWLFSGVGVAALTALIRFVRRLWVPAKQPSRTAEIAAIENASLVDSPIAIGSNISQVIHVPSEAARPTAGISPTQPTPEKIRSEIEGLPLYLQRDAEKNYVAVAVRWRVLLRHISRQSSDNDICDVALSVPGEPGSVIFCEVRTSECPRLRSAKEETLIQVAGFIQEVRMAGLTIRLRDANLTFLDE